MSPDFRKVALIAASLGLIVSLFVALQPDGEDAATTRTTTAAATTEPAATTAPPPEPEVVRAKITVPGDAAPAVRRLSVRRDRQVVLVVEAEMTDEVHVHGYDLTAGVAPDKPARNRFKANAPGIFEIELEDRRLLIAELEVRP